MSIANKYTRVLYTYTCIDVMSMRASVRIRHYTAARSKRDNIDIDTRTGVADYY